MMMMMMMISLGSSNTPEWQAVPTCWKEKRFALFLDKGAIKYKVMIAEQCKNCF